jgi:hypothetical protein
MTLQLILRVPSLEDALPQRFSGVETSTLGTSRPIFLAHIATRRGRYSLAANRQRHGARFPEASPASWGQLIARVMGPPRRVA